MAETMMMTEGDEVVIFNLPCLLFDFSLFQPIVEFPVSNKEDIYWFLTSVG